MKFPGETRRPRDGKCICGHDPHEDPNPDCERCLLIGELSKLLAYIETQQLVKKNLLNALTRYRAIHDRHRWPQDRPCDCDLCKQADEAIKAAKGV